MKHVSAVARFKGGLYTLLKITYGPLSRHSLPMRSLPAVTLWHVRPDVTLQTATQQARATKSRQGPIDCSIVVIPWLHDGRHNTEGSQAGDDRLERFTTKPHKEWMSQLKSHPFGTWRISHSRNVVLQKMVQHIDADCWQYFKYIFPWASAGGNRHLHPWKLGFRTKNFRKQEVSSLILFHLFNFCN